MTLYSLPRYQLSVKHCGWLLCVCVEALTVDFFAQAELYPNVAYAHLCAPNVWGMFVWVDILLLLFLWGASLFIIN